MATYTDQLVVYSGGSLKRMAANETIEIHGLTLPDSGLTLGENAVTSTASELNLLDTASAGSIVNSKAVIYGSSGEVNATTLQIAGTSISSTATELNLVDGSSAGTIVNSKAVIYGSSGEVNATTLQIAGTSITATAAELNYLDITTLGTSEASKAVTVDSNGDLLIPDSDKFKFGAGSDMQLYHDGTNSYITNATGELKIATETSGVAITLGHSTSEVTVADNLTITGNLTVNGTTTTVNSTTVTIDDPVFTLGGDTAPGSDDNKDRGIEFRWHDGENAKLGFFGYDDSISKFTFIADATDTNGVYSGTVSNVAFGAGSFTGHLTVEDGAYDLDVASHDGTNGLKLGGTLVTATAAELNLLDATAGSSLTLAAGDGLIVNDASDSNATKKVLLSDLTTFFSSSGSTTADNITAGSSAVEITTNSGDVVVDAPSGQSVDLQVNGSNVVEVASGRVDISQPLILTNAGVSLAPAAAHPAFSIGHILSFESGANGGLELADCDDTATNYLNQPFGVALETSALDDTSAIMVHTVHGGIVNVKLSSSTTTQGQWVYLSTTAGTATTTAPTSGMVWRLGLSTENNGSAVTDVDVIWMPQFIADLG